MICIMWKAGYNIYMEKIIEQLEKENYDYAVAIATEAEIAAEAACGQLSLIEE